MGTLTDEKMMEFQQSSLYARYIEALHWTIIKHQGIQMFYKRIPIMGGLLKIQRPSVLPDLRAIIKEYNVKTIAVEPTKTQEMRIYKKWVNGHSRYCRVVRSVYLPTKTVLVDVKSPEEEIFRRFSEAKRRAVRKAQKNGVTVGESDNIRELIRIKNISGGFLGFITTAGIDKFWDIMSPKHAKILLAHHNNKLIGGVFVVFWNKTAFYWIAGASREGKKLFAPTLLVWECLKVAKRQGATQFDFLGVWDERKPKEHHDWKGFTRFKEGFGGKTLFYPLY